MPDFKDATIERYIIAIIDVLGQKQELRRFRGLTLVAKNNVAITTAIQSTAKVVADLNSRVRNFFDSFDKADALQYLPPEERNLFLNNPIEIRGIGDSVVVSLSMRNDVHKGTLRGVYGLLASLSSMAFLQGADGRFIRGGIELGLGIQFDNMAPYGDALAEAVVLESEIAEYPRVVLGKQLVAYLQLAAAGPATTPIEKVETKTAIACLELIAVDSDAQWVLDPLGSAAHQQVSRSLGAGAKKLFDELSGNVQRELRKFRANGETKLVLRYELMAAYIDSRRGH